MAVYFLTFCTLLNKRESWYKLGCHTCDSLLGLCTGTLRIQLCPRSFAVEGRAGHNGDSGQLVLLSWRAWMWPQDCFYAVVWPYPTNAALEVWSPLPLTSWRPGKVWVTLTLSKCLSFSRTTQAHGSTTNMCCDVVWRFYFKDKDNITCNGNFILRAFVMLNGNFVEHRNTNGGSHGDTEKKISFLFGVGFRLHTLSKVWSLMCKIKLNWDNLNSGIFKLLSVWFCGLGADF